MRGSMPFDEQISPIGPAGDNSPGIGIKRHMEVVGSERRGRSELGFTNTKMFSTIQSAVRAHQRCDSVQADYGRNSLKNHPGTLLKNFNPRLAPKNQGSE